MGRTLPFPPLPALAPARAAGLPAAGGPPPAVHDASGTARDLQAGEDGTRSLRVGCQPGRRHTVGQSSDLAQWTPLRSWAGLAPGQVVAVDLFAGPPPVDGGGAPPAAGSGAMPLTAPPAVQPVDDGSTALCWWRGGSSSCVRILEPASGGSWGPPTLTTLHAMGLGGWTVLLQSSGLLWRHSSLALPPAGPPPAPEDAAFHAVLLASRAAIAAAIQGIHDNQRAALEYARLHGAPPAPPAAGSFFRVREERGIDGDGDGLTDEQEPAQGLNIFFTDTDGDGMDDAREVANGLDARNDADAIADADGDGFSNLQEHADGTDPRVPDADQDGLPDPWEAAWASLVLATFDPSAPPAHLDETELAALQSGNLDPEADYTNDELSTRQQHQVSPGLCDDVAGSQGGWIQRGKSLLPNGSGPGWMANSSFLLESRPGQPGHVCTGTTAPTSGLVWAGPANHDNLIVIGAGDLHGQVEASAAWITQRFDERMEKETLGLGGPDNLRQPLVLGGSQCLVEGLGTDPYGTTCTRFRFAEMKRWVKAWRPLPTDQEETRILLRVRRSRPAASVGSFDPSNPWSADSSHLATVTIPAGRRTSGWIPVDESSDFVEQGRQKIDSADLVEVLSRDRFLAGSVRVPEGCDDMEIEIVNTDSGENMGRYGSLLPPANGQASPTKVHARMEDILAGDDVIQPETQRVWFVRDPDDPRRVDFYACFNQTGTVQVRLHNLPAGGEQPVGNGGDAPPLVLGHELGEEGPAKAILNGLHRLTRWDGVLDGTPAGGAPGAPLPDLFDGRAIDGPLDALVTPLAIPFFTCLDPVGSAGALAKGALQGMCQGARDDLIFYGSVLAAGLAANAITDDPALAIQACQALDAWLRDKGTSMKDVMAMLRNIVRHCVVDPLAAEAQAVAGDLGTWSGIKKRAMQAARLGLLLNPHTGPPLIAQQYHDQIGRAIAGWCQDYGGMCIAAAGQQAESAAWAAGGWPPQVYSREMRLKNYAIFIGTGFAVGYVGEQVVVGILTAALTEGGAVVAKLGQFLAKGVGVAIRPAPRAVFCIIARMNWTRLLAREAAEAFTPALKEAVELAIRELVTNGLSAEVRQCGAEIIETILRKDVFVRGLCSIREIFEAMAKDGSRIRKLCTPGTSPIADGATVYLREVATALRTCGDDVSATALKGWLNIHETLLPCGESAVAGEVSRVADLIRVCKADTPQGRKMFAGMLELAADKTPAEILRDGLKVPSSVKDVYPQMYHYADLETLVEYAADKGAGRWALKPHKTLRFSTDADFASAEAAKDGLQLPLTKIQGVFAEDPTKGRFLCIFDTAEAGEIRFASAEIHSMEQGLGRRDWLQPITRDNPHRGSGGSAQFAQRDAVDCSVLDLKTGVIVRDFEHLLEVLRNAP